VNSPSMARIGIVYGPEMKPVDPDQEAQIILDNLANGPIYIHEQDLDTFRKFQRLSRREAAETTAARLRDITGVTHQAK
jgi:hypothetical protein